MATIRVERVQTGVRLEKRLMKVLKATAEMLDIPAGTVYSRLHYARKHFAKALQREEAAGGTLSLRAATLEGGS